MADLRISQLPSAATVVSTDILPFTDVSASTTKKIAMDDLALALGILGNSVGSVAPSAPTIGQIWVDTGANPPLVKAWTGTVFGTVSFDQNTSNVTSPGSSGPSSPFTGQLWMDTSSSSTPELKIWNGSNWKRVDPDGQSQTQTDARYLRTTDAASTYLPLAGGVMTGDLTLDGAPTSNNMAATKKFVEDAIAAINIGPSIETGMIIPYGGSGTATTPPSGYRFCNGAAINRTTFSALFGVIGTRFGNGNGSTTFNIPDLRSEFIRGANTMGGNSRSGGLGSNNAGGTQGDTFESHNHNAVSASSHQHSVGSAGSHGHTLSINSNGSHSHGTGQTLNTSADGYRDWGTGSTDDDGNATSSGTGSGGSHGHSGSAGSGGSHNHGNTGNGGGHDHTIENTGSTETRPRNVAVTYLIKT